MYVYSVKEDYTMTYMYLAGIGIITYWLVQKGVRILNLFIPLPVIRLFFFTGLAVYLMAFHYYGNWSNSEIVVVIAIILANLLAEYPSIDYSNMGERVPQNSLEPANSYNHKRSLFRETMDILFAFAIVNALFDDDCDCDCGCDDDF